MAERSLTIERTFAAPIELVFQAWTDPAHLVKWWGPEGMTTPSCEMDVKAGGTWRTCMVDPGGAEHWVSGIYREVSPPRKLVTTWTWDDEEVETQTTTLLTVELRANGGATDMILTHTGFESDESCELHNQGWTSSLTCLEQALG